MNLCGVWRTAWRIGAARRQFWRVRRRSSAVGPPNPEVRTDGDQPDDDDAEDEDARHRLNGTTGVIHAIATERQIWRA
jgi:hypothetical protein